MKRVLLLFCGVMAVALGLFGAAGVVIPSALRAPQIEGRIAYAAAGHIWIWRNGPTQITKANERDGAPALSPDGSTVAFVRYDDSFSDILSAPTTGGAVTFLTDNRPAAETGSPDYVAQASWALAPAYSPDGATISFIADRGTDAPVLWLMDNAGGDPHSLTTEPANPPLERPGWSADGSEIVATSYGSGKQEIWSLDLISGFWQELVAGTDGAYDPAFSPDSKWIVYTQRSGGKHDLWVVPADKSAAPVQLTQMGSARGVAFSPSGNQIAFVALKDQHFEIYIASVSEANDKLTIGSPDQLTDNANVDAASGVSWGK